MTDADCRCPVLLASAEIDKMLELGMCRGAGWGGGTSVTALVIGRLRQLHGCHGPARDGSCPWDRAVSLRIGEGLQTRGDVPMVGRGMFASDGRREPGQFL